MSCGFSQILEDYVMFGASVARLKNDLTPRIFCRNTKVSWGYRLGSLNVCLMIFLWMQEDVDEQWNRSFQTFLWNIDRDHSCGWNSGRDEWGSPTPIIYIWERESVHLSCLFQVDNPTFLYDRIQTYLYDMRTCYTCPWIFRKYWYFSNKTRVLGKLSNIEA